MNRRNAKLEAVDRLEILAELEKTVLDGHPATLAWLGSVAGHRVRSLGVEHFGQTGSIADLYRAYDIDTEAIIAAAEVMRR